MKAAIVVCVGVIAIATVGFFGCSAWLMNAPAVPSSKMAQLQPGMSKAEVRQLLGEPSSRYGSADRETWAYSRWTWAILYLRFDSRGKLTEVEHDE